MKKTGRGRRTHFAQPEEREQRRVGATQPGKRCGGTAQRRYALDWIGRLTPPSGQQKDGVLRQTTRWGAAVVVFLCAVLLMVAGGRLSGQVEALQAATLSITKRVVNMNSALDRMVVLDQKLTMLDEGQAQLAEAIGQVEQDGRFWLSK